MRPAERQRAPTTKKNQSIPLLINTGEDRLWESKFYIPFQPQKWSSNKSNSSVTSSCASCGFLRSRLESQSWNSFNPFPIANRVSAGIPTPRLRQDSAAKDIKTGTRSFASLTESAGVMKSKLSGRHTQPDPQSCRVRTVRGGQRGGAQKQTTHQETKTKLSRATPNRDKRSTANANTEKSIPPAMSQRNQHLTHAMLRKPATTTPKQFKTTWCFGKDTFNQQPCSPESCHSVTLGRVLLFVKAAQFCHKKGHCSNFIFGAVNTLAFWTPRSGPPQFKTLCFCKKLQPETHSQNGTA